MKYEHYIFKKQQEKLYKVTQFSVASVSSNHQDTAAGSAAV